MATFDIRQLPGRRAYSRREQIRRDYGVMAGSPPTKHAATVTAADQRAALQAFVEERYIETGNRQYAGHRFEWRQARWGSKWRREEEPQPKRVESWRVVVTLRNGQAEHETTYEAWKA